MGFGANLLDAHGAGAAFDAVFGKAGIGEEETYYDPIRGVDKRVEIGKKLFEAGAIAKQSIGIGTGGTYTGFGLMPPFVDPSIVDRTVRETPLVRLLPRKAIRGRSYVYNAMTANAASTWLGDDAPLTDQVDTYATTNVLMRYLYSVGRVTGPALASGEGFINLLAENIRARTKALNEELEDTIVNGSNAVDANEFDGIRVAITTNVPASGGLAITLDNLRTDINTSYQANGIIDLAVTDGNTFNVIKGLLMDFQRNVEKPGPQMDFGIPDAFMFDGVLFIKDRFMPVAAAGREILYLDTRYLFLATLQDVTFEELAKTNDSQRYMLKWYGALVVTFEAAMVQRTGIA